MTQTTCIVGLAVAAFTSWLLTITELVGIGTFRAWAFAIGPVVLHDTRAIPLQSPDGGVVETDTWMSRLDEPRVARFRRKLIQPGFFWYTGLLIKGVIRWDEAGARVEGRLPLGPLLFWLVWLVGWTALGIDGATEHAGNLLLVLPGYAIAAAWLSIGIPLEIRRARSALDEYAQVTVRA